MSETDRINNSFPKRNYSGSKNSENKCINYVKCSTFFFICCGIFIAYWLILCPLIWSLLYQTIYSEKWPRGWPWSFWSVAFVVYAFIMILFVVFWEKIKEREQVNVENLADIPFETTQRSENIPENEESMELTLRNPGKLKKVAPPMVITKSIIEIKETDHCGDVKIEKVEENISKISDQIRRSSMKDYLQIVSVDIPSPNDDEEPRSPRDIFFKDFIDAAKKIEESTNLNIFNYDKIDVIDEKNENSKEIEEKKIESPRKKINEKNGEEKFLRTNHKSLEKINDTRRYTMSCDAFMKLLSSNNKFSKSEINLQKVIQQRHLTNRNKYSRQSRSVDFRESGISLII